MDEQKPAKKIYTPHQARLKAESFCAYQERAQQEVRDKLYSWGLHEEDVENIIVQLIVDNFLNEERYAKAFVLGKFRMKGWGKVKIRQQLKMKRVSDPLIRIALQEIDLDEYEQKLEEAIHKRVDKPLSKLSLADKAKLIRFLYGKGFESDLIYRKLGDNDF